MKVPILMSLLAVTAMGGEIEGTVWYNSEGKVAYVEGPAAEKSGKQPFVPEWRKREIARRERAEARANGTYRERYRNDDFGGYGYSYGWFTPGWSVHRPVYGGGSFYGCYRNHGARVSIVIRP